jgi:parallel beta-helix repeat protein
MTRRPFLLSFVLFPLLATAALAQTGFDVSPAILTSPTADAHGFSWQIDVINNGPQEVHNVAVTASTEPPITTVCDALTIDLIYGDSHRVVQCTTGPIGFSGDLVLHAHATAAGDRNPQDDTDTKTVHVIAGGANVALTLGTPTIVPGLPFDIGVNVYNIGAIPATGVTVTVAIPPAVHIQSLPENCTQSGQTVTCSVPDVPINTSFTGQQTLSIKAVADDSRNGQTLPISGDVHTTAPEGDLSNNHAAFLARVYRTMFVTSTQPELLANAMDQANLECLDEYPCKIAFRLGTPPASGYFTLKPQRALPKITGKNISIDGTTQTQLTGDTNPNGPEIFIDGSNNAWEDALVIDQQCEAEIAGFAIGNFTNAAVTISGEAGAGQYPCSFAPGRSVHDNYLGVDPTGTQPAPNGRGVVLNERLFPSVATKVVNNVISANRRSGIWIGRASGNSVAGNRIGLDIHNQPLGNGASGIYVSPSAADVDIRGNYVAFNHDFGIAVDRNAMGTDIGPNSIFANLQLGIDVGLDGPTPDRDIPAPVILSAQYDPATNTTVVTISTHEPPSVGLPTLNIYASDAPHPSGYGDGQYFLGTLRFNIAAGDIHFAALGDWRGKWVSATVTRNNFFGFGFLRTDDAARPNAESPDTHSTTSEFSRAVEVQ